MPLAVREPQAVVPKRNVPVLPLCNMLCAVRWRWDVRESTLIFPSAPGRAKPLRKAKSPLAL